MDSASLCSFGRLHTWVLEGGQTGGCGIRTRFKPAPPKRAIQGHTSRDNFQRGAQNRNHCLRSRAIHFDGTAISGTIPMLSSFEGLLKIKLESTSISGTIPADAASLRGLQDLRLYQTQISGTLPSTVAALPDLGEIEIYDNRMSGTLPKAFGRRALWERRAFLCSLCARKLRARGR